MNSEKKKFEEWRLSICTVKGYSITWTKLCGEDIPYLRFKNQIIGEIHHEYEAWQASAKARDELIKDKILENKDKLIESGMKYADIDTAYEFSVEDEIPEKEWRRDNCFGFHRYYNYNNFEERSILENFKI